MLTALQFIKCFAKHAYFFLFHLIVIASLRTHICCFPLFKSSSVELKKDDLMIWQLIGIITNFASLLDDDSDNSDNSDSDDDSEDIEEDGSRFKDSSRPKNETTEDKKLRKKAIKDAKAEKRKNKMPKHLKKRKEKQGTKKK